MDTYCCAFRSSDLMPCTNYHRAGHNTCHAHRDFYDKTVWKQRFMNLHRRRDLLQALGCSANTRMGRIQSVIEYSLNSGSIVLTEEDVAGMEHVRSYNWNIPHSSLTDVFTVLCGTGKVLPIWNVSILAHTVYNFFKMFNNRFLADVLPSMDSRIGVLLANPDTAPSLIFRSVDAYFKNMSLRHADDGWKEMVKRRHESFIDKALSMPQMRNHLLLSDEKLTSYFFERDEQTSPIADSMKRVAPIAKPHRDMEKAKHKLRMRQYKEGIAMAVWHPRNVERWLNTGGWPLVASIAGDEGLE